MPPRELPLEITELVLDELGAGPREECLSALVACCTARKGFVQRCQQHIFRSVTLHSCANDRITMPGFRDLEELLDCSLQFARTIAHKPHLRSYVRELTFVFASPPFYGNDIHPEAVKPLLRLPNLASLSLCRPPDQANQRVGQRLMQCIASMFRQIPINSFTLVRSLPNSLKHLLLRRSALQRNMGWGWTLGWNLYPDAAYEKSNLKTLICDEQSLQRCINQHLRDQLRERGAYSCLEKLDIDMSPVDIWHSYDSHRLILAEVAHLKELNLTYSVRTWRLPEWNRESSPLKGLNPSSFSSLTHLTFNGNLLVEWDDVNGLQHLHVSIAIQGDLSCVGDRSLGRRWGEICDALTQVAFPKLSEVALSINIQGCSAQANPVRKLFFERVYPHQFQRLVGLDQGGVLQFSFEVEVAEGSTVR
ncbi:hypothetical protein FA13DRAFT_1741694 [Coprinellus micaceus]|uniref:F-box domain-containing protein n=1 Tax=Coprinellus micaceus TaxID=71717 RepID=A0A4Y7SIN6_COPMI|nr:hypothetical protein FA13DRAFT_1741694 [Coprinellus micaceus]